MFLSTTTRPDPYRLNEPDPVAKGHIQTAGRALRVAAINQAERTLVLISAGQSLRGNNSGSLYVPTNDAKISNFNVYDGAAYDCAGPLLGCTNGPTGPGNLLPRVADMLISGNQADQVIPVPLAIGGSRIAEWAEGGPYFGRVPVAMRRLAARGIVPGMAGLTIALEWGQGESDNTFGTSQAAYAAGWSSFLAGVRATGLVGPVFIAQQTYYSGATSAAVRNAQAAAVNGVDVFSAGDHDTIGAWGRSDGVHLNDAGADAATTLIYNGMVASGALF